MDGLSESLSLHFGADKSIKIYERSRACVLKSGSRGGVSSTLCMCMCVQAFVCTYREMNKQLYTLRVNKSKGNIGAELYLAPVEMKSPNRIHRQ